MDYEIAATVVTDIGCRRKVNEDCGQIVRPADPDLLARKGVLAAIADGIGGRHAGDVASRLAIEIITREYYSLPRSVPESLEAAFRTANSEVYALSRKDPRLDGMGTTCTAIAVREGQVYSAHAGDCRVYLIRDGGIYRMTEDHTAVMEMVRKGMISPEELRHHAKKNVIMRALGSQPEVEISTWKQPLSLRPGDLLVLCSDGLHDLVDDEEIKSAMLGSSTDGCEELIKLAKDRGGFDNITIASLRIEPKSPEVPEGIEAETVLITDPEWLRDPLSAPSGQRR